jgi:hypothetical protein
MMNCPICRALLNGAETCRRCRAELKQVQDVERRGRELAGAAMHLLALGDTAAATRLLRRARVVHAAPELRLLSGLIATTGASGSAPAETGPSAFQDTILQRAP